MYDQPKTLYESVAIALVRAIRRISAAKPAIDEDGDRVVVSQEHLATKAGMARSSLTKLLKKGKDANPTLHSICQLADALGVTPAFLLMRERDWKILATAILAYGNAEEDPKFKAFAARLCLAEDHGPAASVQHGRDLAKLTNYLQQFPEDAHPFVREIVDSQIYRIGATSAAPPLQELHSSNPDYVPLLLTLCAAMGAHYRD